MRRAILIAALLAAGCDDDSLPAQVADAQLHGMVQAQARCSGVLTSPTPENRTIGTSSIVRFRDGSFLTTGGFGVEFCSRVEACAEAGTVGPFAISGGLVSLQDGAGPSNLFSAPIEERCTGFNLEAFGVE